MSDQSVQELDQLYAFERPGSQVDVRSISSRALPMTLIPEIESQVDVRSISLRAFAMRHHIHCASQVDVRSISSRASTSRD